MRARRSGAWTLPCGNADPGPGYQTAPGARWLVRSTSGYISWDLVARRSRPSPDTHPAPRVPRPAARAALRAFDTELRGFVRQVRRQPLLGLFNADAESLGVRLRLVATDASHVEIFRAGV